MSDDATSRNSLLAQVARSSRSAHAGKSHMSVLALAASLAGADSTWIHAPPELGWDAAAAMQPLGARAHIAAGVDALLAGKPPLQTQRPSIGCNIKWIRGSEPDYFTGQAASE